MNLKDFKGTKGLIIGVILVVLIVGYFYYLSNRNQNPSKDDNVKIGAADELLLMNFKVSYPPSPKEVVKHYLEFTKVLHNEKLTDEEVDKVGIKLQELFDEELVTNKSKEEYLKDLKSELMTFRNNEYSIVNMYTSSAADVNYFYTDGYECASLYGTFNIRTSSGTQVLREIFILRKDESNHWKIYGFTPMSDEELAGIEQ